MRRLTKRVVKEVLKRRIGLEVLELVELLRKHKDLSEFKLSEMLNEDINSVRNKLYRLQQFNLIGFTKKKDEARGWYVYFWHLKPEMFYHLYRKMLDDELKKLNSEIEQNSSVELYTCPNRCVAVTSEDALLCDYTCPECGSLLRHTDNSKLLNSLVKKRDRIMKTMDKLE